MNSIRQSMTSKIARPEVIRYVNHEAALVEQCANTNEGAHRAEREDRPYIEYSEEELLDVVGERICGIILNHRYPGRKPDLTEFKA